MMRPIPAVLAPVALAFAAALAMAAPAEAACYAQYKAKQDNPLRFHVGVAVCGRVRLSCTPLATRRTDIGG